MVFRSNLLLIGSVAGLWLAGATAAQDNILVVIADDLGVDKVGVYREGPNPPPTPNIDALAARGVLFRNAWATPMCTPTRACFHTGRYAFRTFVGLTPEEGGGIMSPDEVTLPEVVAAAGYEPALIGKWHLGTGHGGARAPNVAGWSHFAGYLGGQTTYRQWNRTVNGLTSTSPQYITTQIVDDAIAWIGSRTGPWLCMVSFTAPHVPLHKPPASLHTQDLTGKTPASHPVDVFAAMVEAMDTEIGRLLASLGPALASTNVIFVADNGTDGVVVEPPFVASRAKGTPYEGGVNVPLIVAGPAVQRFGEEETALIASVDLFATVADLAGVDLASVVPPWVTVDGVSMVPYLRAGGHAPLRSRVLAEKFTGADWSATLGSGFATLADGRFKLVRRFPIDDSRVHQELYDLANDPFENNDLLASPLSIDALAAYAALTRELTALRRIPGRLVVFGAATCEGSAGALEITGGAPRIGRSYPVELARGAALQPAVLLAGRSTTQFGAWSLPFDLSALGAGPGCVLRTSGEVAVPAATDDRGRAALDLAVPDLFSLVGQTWFHSWLVMDPNAPTNPIGLTVSNAAAAVVGF